MKSFLRLPPFALLFALLLGISSPGAWAGCQTCVANLKLPPAPGSIISLTENTDPAAPSFLTATIYNSDPGLDVHDGDYLAWCVDSPAAALNNSFHYGLPVSTYSGTNAILSPNWPKVNYLLNHKAPGATAHDIQRDIWLLLGQTPSAGFDPTPLSIAMFNDADANGAAFIPVAPQVVGVVLGEDGPGGVQDTMIEVPAPPCGTIGDWVFQDTDRNGLQNAGDIGINGVTVKLTDAAGNLLATTVTGPTPAGYTYIAPGTPGYYQFSGWAACTYKITIDDNQPALAGYTPTTPLVGGGSNAATDSNHSSGDLTVLPTDTSVDETIDFGYVTLAPMTVACAPTTGTFNTFYSYPISVTGGVPQYTFTLVGTLPAGLSLDSQTGIISGTPTAYGSSSFSVQVKDATGLPAGTKVTNCTINIPAPPISVQCAGTTGQQGVYYSSAIVATGGSGTFVTYALIAGRLPNGLTLNPATGAITGTPTENGTFSYTVQVTDSLGATATTGNNSCTLVIAPPVLAVVCAPATTGRQGVAYSSSVVASGGTGGYQYSVVGGALPDGVTLNAATGLISGTPTVSGAFSYKIQVKDSAGTIATTGTTSCTLVIAPPTLTVICAPATTGQQGVAYGSSVVASGGTGGYQYSVVGGALPAGVTLNATTGLISGTPTVSGTFSYKIQVKDSSGTIATTGTTSCTLVIAPPPLTVICAPATTGQIGVAYSSSVVATGGSGGYQYSLTGGTLPAGVTLNAATGLISGTPTAFGTFSYKIQVKDSAGSIATTGTTSCTLVIAPLPPTLQCGTCTSGKATVGVSYSAKLAVTGGSGTGYTFTLDTGSVLPPGLTLNATTGVITGTPTTPGTYIVSTVVTDSLGGTDTVSCTIIVSGPPLNLDCGTCGSNRATAGSVYTSTLAATGGKPGYTYSIYSGSLPPGLTLNPATGVIGGTPTATGTYTFTSKVVDANGIVDTARCTIYVVASPVNLDCGSCGSSHVNVGATYSSQLTVTGGKAGYTYSIVSGSLPTGLTLNTSTGAITGTPTTPGTYTFTSKVVDANGYTDTATCTITVAGTPVNLDCGACGTANGKVGTAFTSSFALSGGKAPYIYAITSGSLPPGLTLSTTGTISGTPTTAGTYTFTTTVTDAYGSKDTATCTIIVTGSAINLDCGACKSGKATLGVAYSNTLSVTGAYGSVTFSIVSGSLPTGLMLNSTTGKISGTPTAVGTFTFTSQVKDSQGHIDTDICSITVAAIPLDIQCGSCSAGNGTVGSPYSATFAVTGGVAGFTFSITSGSLPAGLTLNTSTGVVSGTPTTAGTSTFTVMVRDSRGTTDTVTCTIAVVSIPLDIQCGTCGANRVTAGMAYSVTLAAAGGSGSYTYSIVSGALPSGLTLNAVTGIISGTPATPGAYTFTSQVKDSKGKIDTVTCTINVVAPVVNLDCGTCGANKAQTGVLYSSTLKPTGGIGSYTFAITAGTLPPGITLNPTTGVISGTPTADGTFTFTSKATDSKGNSDTADCSIVVMGSVKTGDYVTYTQGGWGATPNGNNPGTLLKNNFTKVYGSGSVSIGGNYKLTFNSASAIASFLPQGGTPGVLSTSASNPAASPAGVFAGEVLALQLSVDFSNKGVTPGGLSSLKLNSGALSGQTIAQVLALANAVLGGNTSALPAGLTVSGLNDIIDSINNNFDSGTTNAGCLH